MMASIDLDEHLEYYPTLIFKPSSDLTLSSIRFTFWAKGVLLPKSNKRGAFLILVGAEWISPYWSESQINYKVILKTD